MTSAKIIADSWNGKTRLTTVEAKFHRFILPEVLTHRVFSRNTSSSRAIPLKLQIERILEDPAYPIFWGKNQPGMSAYTQIDDVMLAEELWIDSMNKAICIAAQLNEDCKLHKQLASRLIEPYMWTTMIISSTEWDNFFKLRHPGQDTINPQFPAQPEIQQLAIEIGKAMESSDPVFLKPGEWHLPYIDGDDRDNLSMNNQIKVSAGRCARVSYLTHDGVRDAQKDLELADKLASNNHMSPLEHQARCMGDDKFYANFRGFSQYRGFVERGLNVSLSDQGH